MIIPQIWAANESSRKNFCRENNIIQRPRWEATKLKVNKFVKSEYGEYAVKILDAKCPGVFSIYKCFFEEGLTRNQKIAHGIWGAAQVCLPMGSKALKHGIKVIPKLCSNASNAKKVEKFLTNTKKINDMGYDKLKWLNNYKRCVNMIIDKCLKEREIKNIGMDNYLKEHKIEENFRE